MNISENGKIVLEKRYVSKDKEGKNIENVEGLFRRVAKAIAAADKNYGASMEAIARLEQEFFDAMTEVEFLPNSPTLMNAGKDLGQLSACFVLPVPDSMEEIFETIKNAALIHKSGGGTGFSFSRLRSKGSVVKSTGGVASGPVSFMKVFNAATEAVKQGGTRRGANMGILNVDHPDILEFIDCKKNTFDITNFNISVGITEKFMKAVEAGTSYDLVDPVTKEVVSTLDAKTVYDKIIEGAWSTGEPGIVFIDRLNKFNVVPSQGAIEATNPCGEQPLLPYESCNLGSINLRQMICKENGKVTVDYKKLEKTVALAVHFLDNVIDVNKYPLAKIDEVTRATRKIGLGIMGFSDLMLMMNIPYSSDKCIEQAEEIMKFITDAGKRASVSLANSRGAFPLFSKSKLSSDLPQRNATITTIAPTGTLSIIGGCSSGIEPVFAYAYIRNILDGTQMVETHDILKNTLKDRGIYSEELMEKIASEGSLAHIAEIPQDLKNVFVCAHDIEPIWHVKVLAAFQKHTDNAVSKTVNFENHATKEEVDEVYRLAYNLGCKGVTIYRDGSRQNQVLNIKEVNAEKVVEIKEVEKVVEKVIERVVEVPPISCKECPNFCEEENSCSSHQRDEQGQSISPRPRPDVVQGFTEKVSIGCGNLYITVNFDKDGIVEVFTNTGKAGGCPSQSEATARLVSISLRSGVDPKKVISQLRGIRCPSTIRQQNMKVTSCPDAIAKVIEKVIKMQEVMRKEGGMITEAMVKPIEGKPSFQRMNPGHAVCPECGGKIEHEGGCVICRQCGYSKCG